MTLVHGNLCADPAFRNSYLSERDQQSQHNPAYWASEARVENTRAPANLRLLPDRVYSGQISCALASIMPSSIQSLI